MLSKKTQNHYENPTRNFKKEKKSKTIFKIQNFIHIFSFRKFELLFQVAPTSFSRDSIVNFTKKGPFFYIFLTTCPLK